MLAFHQTGFSFVYMDDERDAEDAIRGPGVATHV